jgi:broad specificity phosphatase PhoE
MRLVYIIRHASPAVQPGVASRDWPLSDRGIEESQSLAAAAEGWELRAIYSSSEAKARATAGIVGERFGLQVNVADAFDELRIPEFIANSDEFNDVVRAVLEDRTFEPPRLDPLLSGRLETADTAAERFAAGIGIVEQGAFPAAIVSHGRIIAAYLAAVLRSADPFALWRSIPMPGWASVDLDAPEAGLLRAFDD